MGRHPPHHFLERRSAAAESLFSKRKPAQDALQRSITDMVDPHPNANSTAAGRARSTDKMAATAKRLNTRNR